MKKILIFFEIIILILISLTILISCNIQNKYTSRELAILKEKNKINITNKETTENLEWIAPQEKPFNKVDNKWYFVIWRGNKNDNWRIIKFKNDTYLSNKQTKNINIKNNYELYLFKIPGSDIDLFIQYIYSIKPVIPLPIIEWQGDKDNIFFKAIYRLNLDKKEFEFDLIIDTDNNIKIK